MQIYQSALVCNFMETFQWSEKLAIIILNISFYQFAAKELKKVTYPTVSCLVYITFYFSSILYKIDYALVF